MTQRIHWQDDSASDSLEDSRHSGSASSARSRSTAPTEYSDRPPFPQHDTCYGRVEGWESYQFPQREYDYDDDDDDDDISIATYASTVPSEADEEEDDEMPGFEVPDLPYHQVREPEAIPATPRDFGDLFPSSRELSIAHDDSTIDGNMNLRVDVPIRLRNGTEKSLTLFHLRLHDLRNREFSLRRYCRDSGREVCHTVRKYQKPAAEKRPTFQRSFSNAIANLRSSKGSDDPNLRRQDSGYESVFGLDSLDEESTRPKTAGDRPSMALMPTNTIKLEFSNYAHIDVKRRGAKTNKRYEFEYWGNDYAWRRVTRKVDNVRVTSYHLLRHDSDRSLAQIAPFELNEAESHEEASKGGWIPPCSMQITDDQILSSGDVAE
jgi:hypothetical protein